jgi:glyoxylase-like metal-dependent hydrolase (beta-lactamase superfamily II)
MVHWADADMCAEGNMFAGRGMGNPLLGKIVSALYRVGSDERFGPDVLADADHDLSPFGLEGRIVHIPGHSPGSIGVLTQAGELFCGDLMVSTRHPALNSLMPDRAAARRSLELLRGLGIKRVYPGHGPPFGLGQVPIK